MVTLSMTVKKTSTQTVWSTLVKQTRLDVKILVMKTTTAFKIGKKTSLAPYGTSQIQISAASMTVMSETSLTEPTLVIHW